MSIIIIDEILDPIGNRKNNEPPPTLYCKNTNIKRIYGIRAKWGVGENTELLQYHAAIFF